MSTSKQKKNVASSGGHPFGNLFSLRSGREILKELRTTSQGLSEREALERRGRWGLNQLPQHDGARNSLFVILLRQFANVLVVILLAASVISLLLGDVVDAQVILGAVLINVCVGAFQERRAQHALAALQKVVITKARVLRDGALVEIPQEELVPGDIVSVQAGDRVPADLRLLSEHALEANESMLTGEAHPVKKDVRTLPSPRVLAEQLNMLWLGTVVTAGRGSGVVVATGAHTQVGHIALLLARTPEEQTPLQKQLNRFGRELALAIMVVVALIFGFGIFKGEGIANMFATSIAVAVSAIPEGLTIAVTVVLAIGMQRILTQKGLMKKLHAAETLGATSVICTDKTGTLTVGEMQVVRVETNLHSFTLSREHVLRDAKNGLGELVAALVLCNDAAPSDMGGSSPGPVVTGNTTDRALMRVALDEGIDVTALRNLYPRTAERPFNSKDKYMCTLHRLPGAEGSAKRVLFVKGAPEVLFPFVEYVKDNSGRRAPLSHEGREALNEKVEHMSGQGLRVLCVTKRDIHGTEREFKKMMSPLHDLMFLGFIGIQDPLREGAGETIVQAERAGIRTVMITGDHRLTATSIGRTLGLLKGTRRVMDGSELKELSVSALAEKIDTIAVFSRATPEDKLRIIAAWKAKGAVVAMTGDGVNDAPALKAADIGVALGSGTDVAKESSDLVLLDNHIRTIASAVREGRLIYHNIRTVALYMLSNSFTETIAITFALLMGWPLPYLPAQILWVNIVTDTFPALALTQEPAHRALMREKPRVRGESILMHEHRWLIGAISTCSAFLTLLLFSFYWSMFHSLELARTVAFTTLSVTATVYVFSLRSLQDPIWHIPVMRNPMLILATATGFVLQIAVIYLPALQHLFGTIPLQPHDWLLIAFVSCAFIGMIEWMKHIFHPYSGQKRT
ncbi:MAG: HAD-IC family P-type ATPase [Patescibacteria group bacterium]